MSVDAANGSAAADAGAGFAALEAQALQIEASAAPPGTPGAPPAPIDNAAELEGALEMARLLVAPMFHWWDRFGDVWSDAALRRIAEGGAAVMAKHGWTMGGLLAEFGPYVALATATAPPVFVTWQAMKAHRDAQLREARERSRSAGSSAPGDAPNR